MNKTNKNDEREVMVSHQSDLLTQDLILTGVFKYCKFSDYGFSFDFPFIKYEHGSGDISYPVWQVNELKRMVLSEEHFVRLINFLKEELGSYTEFLKKFEKIIKSQDDREKKIEEYFNKSLRAAATIPYFAFELSLYKKLEEEGVSPRDIHSSITDTTLASLEIEKIFKKFQEELKKEDKKISEKLKKDLKKFCKRFGYLGMIYFKGKPWKVNDAYRMLLSSRTSTQQAKQKTKIKSKHLEFASELLKLRTQKWEAMCYGTYLFRKYIEKFYSDEIVYEDLLNLRIEEVLDLINGIYSPKDKGQGRNYFSLEITEKGVILEIKKEQTNQKEKIFNEEIKGTVAQPGKVVGKAKIVITPKEGYKVDIGDILVTKMSTPDFLPIIKKASAIITDFGGITSHAAIVAREMNKPCIIGTRVATQVLHDGDLVEVDADSGVVRVLERAQ